ncbi:mannitol dehydrogenase family protein [Pararhizobium sp. IMCC21322]|uniref:mannitol dehydrogenase family protein n=1 Tax=Pararhizobium sp. IMCC21322 TaxID=3067903 RepID=UPI00274279FD|nr:mannitol dehydrogenase family protein [Pararhizobium sp. IMCC21322]
MKRILHLGPGNFFRAHQAWYTHHANAHGNETWQITGVSLKSSTARDNLAPQDCDYTLVINSVADTDYQRITVIDRILVGPENPQAIIDLIADPATVIVSLTVTEKGYHIDAKTGHLNTGNPDIAAEMSDGQPRTAIGFLAFGLQQRQQQNADPITIISCDNLSDNGATLKKLVQEFDQEASVGLADWLKKSVTFPGTMVDRITPATTDSLRQEVHQKTGWADASPVATELFSEWIIEDNFAAARPAWDQAGAQFVDDVSPFEQRKLRLLNGTHSFLAYAGLYTGHTYVHEAIADALLRKAVEDLMLEATATLPAAMHSDAADYCTELIERFANPALKHELAQIAGDGSQKLPVRILSTITDRDSKGIPSPRAFDAIAYWLVFIHQRSAAGADINDPLAKRFAEIQQSSDDRRSRLSAILQTLSPDASLDQDRILDRAETLLDA